MALNDGDAVFTAAVIRSNHLHALTALEEYFDQHGKSRHAVQ